MSTSSRIAPLRSLLESRIRPLDTEPWLGRLPADPQRAWAGRVRLDRARVESRPDDADAWWRLGVGLHALGRPEDASGAFSRALRRDLGASRRPSLVVHTDRPSGFDRTFELIAAAQQMTRARVHWICTAPSTFEAALRSVHGLDARVYCIESRIVASLLGDDRSHRLGAVLLHEAQALGNLPSRVRRVRLPRAWVESRPDDAGAFDAMLCPSRISARAWSDATTVPVVWPAARQTGGESSALVVDVSAAPTSAAAWDDDSLRTLLERLLLETRDVPVVVVPSSDRCQQALRVRREWLERATGTSPDRLRVELGARWSTSLHPSSVVITEPHAPAWAGYLRYRGGIVVFDPHHVATSAVAPRTVDSALRVVESIHVHANTPDALAREREAVVEAILFDESSSDARPLSAVLDDLGADPLAGASARS